MRSCRDWLNTQQVLISERRNELYLENQRQKRLPKYPEELRREESQIAAEEELDKVFLQPFRDYLKTQRSQPQRAADGKGAEHLRDAAFAQALRSRFGLQRSGFRVWAAIDDPAIEKYCYTQGGKRHTLEGFRVVPAGADQQQLAAEQGGTQPRGPQGGEEAHQEPVEPEIRTVVRRKKGAKVSQMGETSAANDRVQDWLDRDRRGPPGYR
ncbi:hypothetical protein SLS62_001460 [Diatrype stigma]|uniref:Uncharacterized protein n=1 Tax=Diatrype stigma TaxID=117547 RepID=A0AAN9VAM5_9PEZI